MPKREFSIESGNYYHLYNRGVNRGRIFFVEKNYSFFILLLSRYFQPFADVLAYCLMPNHFHLVIQAKSDQFLTKALHPFLLTYSKSINKQEKRIGPLFQGRYQANFIDSDDYLLDCVKYVHLNPVKANLVDDPSKWLYSSYQIYISGSRDTFVNTIEVLRFFDTLQDFREFSEFGVEEYQPNFQIMED